MDETVMGTSEMMDSAIMMASATHSYEISG
jgi:hypothetical protein